MRIFLDLDGVLVEFVAAAYAAHGLSFPGHAGVRWCMWRGMGLGEAEFWRPLGYEFWAGLGWTAEGRELLDGVEGAFGQENVALLTSACHTPGGTEGKVAWVTRELPAYRGRLIVTGGKHLLAGPDAVLVDDADHNVRAFRAAGGRAVLVPRPWNEAGGDCGEGGGYDPDFVLRALESFRAAEGAGHPGYLKLLAEMADLHRRKAADYGSDADPFHNIRASAEVGVEPWRGAWLRAKDKVKRIDQFCLKGTLANEGVEDSLMDLAAYALIVAAIRREGSAP